MARSIRARITKLEATAGPRRYPVLWIGRSDRPDDEWHEHSSGQAWTRRDGENDSDFKARVLAEASEEVKQPGAFLFCSFPLAHAQEDQHGA